MQNQIIPNILTEKTIYILDDIKGIQESNKHLTYSKEDRIEAIMIGLSRLVLKDLIAKNDKSANYNKYKHIFIKHWATIIQSIPTDTLNDMEKYIQSNESKQDITNKTKKYFSDVIALIDKTISTDNINKSTTLDDSLYKQLDFSCSVLSSLCELNKLILNNRLIAYKDSIKEFDSIKASPLMEIYDDVNLQNHYDFLEYVEDLFASLDKDIETLNDIDSKSSIVNMFSTRKKTGINRSIRQTVSLIKGIINQNKEITTIEQSTILSKDSTYPYKAITPLSNFLSVIDEESNLELMFDSYINTLKLHFNQKRPDNLPKLDIAKRIEDIYVSLTDKTIKVAPNILPQTKTLPGGRRVPAHHITSMIKKRLYQIFKLIHPSYYKKLSQAEQSSTGSFLHSRETSFGIVSWIKKIPIYWICVAFILCSLFLVIGLKSTNVITI
ncbi:hypothetical protein NEOKW01_2063 [Nematocida sp. AWRm80]|nr:hypothetical protein NEOKW01_2063 [Nematocida sp. AWRm80]